MLKITQILLQSRKSNLILIGEPGVGKTGIVEGFAQLLAEGKLAQALGRPAVIVLTSNLGAGQMRRKMGFGMEQDGGGQDARATVEAAIRRHLRPELVNRLTRIVHFKPLGMDTVREIPGKMVRELNERLADAVIAEAANWYRTIDPEFGESGL
jgi:ATP-dependent Clp protease ATP-binding subunit ClpC